MHPSFGASCVAAHQPTGLLSAYIHWIHPFVLPLANLAEVTSGSLACFTELQANSLPNAGQFIAKGDSTIGMQAVAGPSSPLKPNAVADWLALEACPF